MDNPFSKPIRRKTLVASTGTLPETAKQGGWPRPAPTATAAMPSPGTDPVEKAMAEATAPALPRLLTPEDVAGILNIGERTLERWRSSGEGPRFIKLSRATVRYTADEVASFIAERVKANTL